MTLADRINDAVENGQIALDRFILRGKIKENELKAAVEVVINHGWCLRGDPVRKLRSTVKDFFTTCEVEHTVYLSPDNRTFVIKDLSPSVACALATYVTNECYLRDPADPTDLSMKISIKIAEVTLPFSNVWC